MKLFLILGCVIAMLVWSVKKFTANEGTHLKMFGGDEVSDVKASAPSPAASHPVPSLPGVTPVGDVNAVPPVIGAPIAEPMIWGKYRFRFRAVPDQTVFSMWTSLGAQVMVDPVSREVAVRAPSAVVDQFVSWCERSDLVPGSCTVHAWTVYVDQSVQKGFDLAAAINAVSGDGYVTGNLSSGAIKLNLGFDKVSAALVAIADGTVVEVVQNPFVRLVDATEARIEAIQELPVPESNVSNGISQKSIKFRKVGLQLGINPRFHASDRVSLDITQTNGVVGAPITIDGNPIPVVESQTVASRVDMQVGETVVLGGVRTFRNRTVKGLLRNTVEKTEGALYVVLSTHSDEPRAIPVDPLEPPRIGSDWVAPVPGSVPIPSADEWLIGELLPPLDGRIVPASKK